jgi:hypothetical protein
MSRVPPYSRHVRAAPTLSPTGLSPATAARSSGLRLGWRFLTASGRHRSPPDPVQPRRRNGGTLGTPTVWACTVSLAATPAPYYFLRVHEMFQFPGLPPPGLCVHPGVARLTTLRGSPIRRSSAPSPRAAPRGISLLRHVLLRHERPRHPPDALSHGLHFHPRPQGRPRRRRPVPHRAHQPPTHLSLISHPAHATPARAGHCFALVLTPHFLRCARSRPRLLPDNRQAANGDSDRKRNGGDEETRTPDPLRAKEVLSQLSYIPKKEIGGRLWIRTTDLTLIRGVL